MKLKSWIKFLAYNFRGEKKASQKVMFYLLSIKKINEKIQEGEASDLSEDVQQAVSKTLSRAYKFYSYKELDFEDVLSDYEKDPSFALTLDNSLFYHLLLREFDVIKENFSQSDDEYLRYFAESMEDSIEPALQYLAIDDSDDGES